MDIVLMSLLRAKLRPTEDDGTLHGGLFLGFGKTLAMSVT
jgi:hypothetical protein